MAIWSYGCRSCDGSDATWHVSVDRIAEMPPDTRFVRVKVGGEWKCAVLIPDSVVEIEAQLLRDVIPSSPEDCPECSRAAIAATRERPTDRAETDQGAGAAAAPADAGQESRASGGGSVQAAAISLQGVRFVVVVVGMDLVRSAGEADMAIETLAPSFGGVPVVLMAQDDEGSPRYHGDRELVAMLAGVPIEHMPWKTYPLN